MRFVVNNCVSLNGGDAAILRGLLRTLELAFATTSADVDVFDSQASAASRYYPDIGFRPWMWGMLGGRFAGWRRRRAAAAVAAGREVRRLRSATDRYRRADAVISTGGTYLVEQYDLAPRLFELETTRALGVPLVLFTQSLGPFRNADYRRRLRGVLDEAALVLLRDRRSAEHVRDLGVDHDRLHVVADAAFTLTDSAAVEATLGCPERASGRVAISVRDLSHFRSDAEGLDRYRRSVAACVRELVRRGYRVTFLSTCQGIAEYWLDDSREAREIVRMLPPDELAATSVDDAFHDPIELRDLYRGFDFVIATRMHAGILALTAGTPVFPIAYEFKTGELFGRLGAPETVQDVHGMEPESVAAALRSFVEDLGSIGPTLMRGVLRERSSAVDVADLLRSALAGDRAPTGSQGIGLDTTAT